MDKGVIADGFLSKTVVTMKDPQGDVLWQKSYIYLSKDYDRGMSVDELEANDCDLLKEEMMFAAEKTVQDFVNHLNGNSQLRCDHVKDCPDSFLGILCRDNTFNVPGPDADNRFSHLKSECNL